MTHQEPDHKASTETDRRNFLKLISTAGALILGAFAGLPALLSFVTPAFRRSRPENWIALGQAEFFDWQIPIRIDVPQTVTDAWMERRIIRSVWIYTEDGEDFTIFNGRCTHLACAYSFDEEEDMYICPCHQGLYDTVTGDVLGGPPPRPLDTLEGKIENGVLFARWEDFRPGISEKTAI
ncbi:MAG: hypothetical protein BMS9Abin29_2207 [Gemmatimonadota bacterium]|nr:MAG: hypothetical protein BMS9Abin29_2207 [Gemmatimonadota bacterium]